MLFALRHNNSIKTTTIVEVCTGTGILMVMWFLRESDRNGCFFRSINWNGKRNENNDIKMEWYYLL